MNLGEILADQIASVPLLSTVLRVDLTLQKTTQTRSSTIELLTKWINERTEARDLGFSWELGPTPFSRDKFHLDWAENEDCFVASVERPDDRQAGRSWIVEVALNRVGTDSVLSTRLAIRQSKSLPAPVPRAPKFISELVSQIGAWDVIPLSEKSSFVDLDGVEQFAEFLCSPSRTLPVIVVSEDERTNEFLADSASLASLLAGTGHVFALSNEACHWITDNFGKQYSVYHGAVRCFGAGFTFQADPKLHRLWLDSEVVRLGSIRRNGFEDAVIRHAFAQDTAAFESLPLPSARTVRRQIELAAVVQAAPASSSVQIYVAPESGPDLTAIDETAETSLPRPAIEDLKEIEALNTEIGLLRSQLAEMSARLQDELQSREVFERDQEKELQTLRAENAVISQKLNEEFELRNEFERENVNLEAQLAIYTGKAKRQDDTLASKFLRAFGDAFGSARDLIESQSVLEAESRSTAVELEQLRNQLAEARAERFRLSAQVQGLSLRADGIVDSELDSPGIALQDSDSLELFFSHPPNTSLFVTVTNQARKSFADCPYLDGERMRLGLELLRDKYLPMKLASDEADRGLKYQELTASLHENSMKWGRTATQVGRGRAPEDHTILSADGRTLICEKIRDKRSTFDRQNFLCIYFAWDDLQQHLYIKGFEHGDTPSART